MASRSPVPIVISRRGSVAGSAMLMIASATAALGDGPGMLLYTSPPAGSEVSRTPFRPYRSIGRAPQSEALPVLPLIGRDGRVHVLAPDESPLRTVPDSMVAPEQVVYTPLGFCMARGGAGGLWAWGATSPAWMPEQTMVSIDAGRNAVGGIASDGSVVLWNLEGPLAPSAKLPAVRALSLGLDWGAAISVDGELHLFSFGAVAEAPPIRTSASLAAISVDGDLANARAVAIDADGALRSLIGGLEAPGLYEKVSVSTTRLVALDIDGRAQGWDWSDEVSAWTPAAALLGIFSEVGVAGSHRYLVLDGDANRDGIEDSHQILAGEVADVNGDMLADEAQPPTVLLDEDRNGRVDRAESPGTGEGRWGGQVWSFVNWSMASIAHFGAVGRVPVAAEAFEKITLFHFPPTVNHQLPAEGLSAEFALWLDPSSDGDPSDAVLAAVYPVTLSPDGWTVVDLGGVSLGPPGTTFFQTLSYVIPPFRSYFLFYASAPRLPVGVVDLLGNARWRSRVWTARWPLSQAPATREERVHASMPWGIMGSFGTVVPLWTLVWGDRGAGDCDGDGILDATWVNPDLDLNLNRVVDACEGDCDGDGQYDFAEVGAGAADCNMDLIPDACWYARAIDISAPSAGVPVVIDFLDLPDAQAAVYISVEVSADLGSAQEFLLLQFPGHPVTALFVSTGHDCPAPLDRVVVEVSADTFNAAVLEGELRFSISASAAVSAGECPNSMMRVSLSYDAGINDCDGNGIEDSCQHGWSEDCNGDSIPDACQLRLPGFDADGNGILDVCEFSFADCDGDGTPDASEIADGAFDKDQDGIPDDCEYARGDFDLDGDVGATDLTFLLAYWGVVDLTFADLDGDGVIAAGDLAVLLANWGPTGL